MSRRIPLTKYRRMREARNHVAPLSRAEAKVWKDRNNSVMTISGAFQASVCSGARTDEKGLVDRTQGTGALLGIALQQILGVELRRCSISKKRFRPVIQWKITCLCPGFGVTGHAIQAVVEMVLQLEALSHAIVPHEPLCQNAAETCPIWPIEQDKRLHRNSLDK